MEISIKRLREYIENDKEYQQFKTAPEETLHEYARLHYIRCWDIENVLNENQQLKSVLDEIREYIEHEWFKRGQLGIIDKTFQEWQLKDILQILDKVKE